MDFVIKAEWDDGWSVGPAEPPLPLTRVNLLTLIELLSANQSLLDSGGKHVYSLHRYPDNLSAFRRELKRIWDRSRDYSQSTLKTKRYI